MKGPGHPHPSQEPNEVCSGLHGTDSPAAKHDAQPASAAAQHHDAAAARRRLAPPGPGTVGGLPDAADQLSLRAGDQDRERAGTELRHHHLAGRIDDVELEERVARAYAARTLRDLFDLLNDLPVLSREALAETDGGLRSPEDAGRPGKIAFAQTHDLPVPVEEAYAEALDLVVLAMAREGLTLVERRASQVLVFARRERRAWLVVGPHRSSRVRVDFLPRAGGRCQVRVSGEARRGVRKAFAALSG